MKLLSAFIILFIAAPRAFGQSTQTFTVTPRFTTLRNAELPPHIKDQIAHVYSTWFSSPSDPPYLLPKEVVLDFNVSFPHLANHGRQVILLESTGTYADATGNGQMWFFLRSGNSVRLILYASGFLFYPSHSYDVPHPVYRDGLRDIAIGWNMSSSEDGIHVYRFNGHDYISDYCDSYNTNDSGNTKLGQHEKCEN